jgi:drug/metabolite transporter (DMT)-like permease
VGFVGIGVLARPGGHGGAVQTWGIVVILVGTLCWAAGTFLSPRLGLPANPFVGTTVEMLTAGLVMMLLAVPMHEWDGVHLAAVPAEAWWALAYLVVFGSLLAFTAFVWLVGHAPLSLVSTYAYVNPVVAVLLGWALLAEPVTAVIVAGGGLAVLGVFLVVLGERPRTTAS